MIDGERGHALIEQMVVLRAGAMMDGDMITTQALGSVLVEAMRSGTTPREVVVGIWDVLPSDDDWAEVVREKFEEACDQLEERGL